MSKKVEEITIQDLEKQIQAASKDASLPAWVSLLFSMILFFFKEMNEQLKEITIERDELKRKLYGKPKNERKKVTKSKPKTSTRKARNPNRITLDKTELEEEIKTHPAPKICPKCGHDKLTHLNSVRESIEYIYKPARLVRVRHRQQKCVCKNGCTVITAPAPMKVAEGGGRFGPCVYAQIMSKRAFDAIPFSRQADQWSRNGIPFRKTTICDLFHRGSQELKPIYDALLLELCQAEVLHADETPQPFLAEGRTRRGYMWVIAHDKLSGYVFSKTRSGEIPKQLLSDEKGILVVDAYTGYNKVTQLESWQRAGCLAHARRKFVDALNTDYERASAVIDLFAHLYHLESEIRIKKLQGSQQHLDIRQAKSKPLMNQLKALLKSYQAESVLPKSPLGKAIKYTLNQWQHLTLFLSNAKIPLDNNHAERLLRRIALSRKTSLFMSPDRGDSYAIVLSLVQSCRLCGINPEQYLQDVLLKVQTTPHHQVKSLLPTNWVSPEGIDAHAWV